MQTAPKSQKNAAKYEKRAFSFLGERYFYVCLMA